MPDRVLEPDFEVLSPEDVKEDDLSRILAWVLDDLIPIPGTKVRVGLDPLIGLVPGFGDSSTALLSSLLLIRALKARMPRVVMVRMALNILLNSLVGAIPFVGDFFSAWFKSNRRNYELLQKHAGSGRVSTRGDWIFILSLLGIGLAITIGLSILVGYLLFKGISILTGY